MSWVKSISKPTVSNLFIKNVVSSVDRIRALGSLALQFAMVAQGGADVAVSADAKIWDIAAGDLIVREAGGVTYNLDGGTANVLTGKLIGASTPEVALSLINLHRKYKNQTQT